MARGPYEPSLRRFVDCLNSKVEKDKPYTFEELEGICSLWYRTIRDYATIRLSDINIELNKRGKKIKNITVQKQVCQIRSYPGLIVDPPKLTLGQGRKSSDFLLFFTLVALKFISGFIEEYPFSAENKKQVWRLVELVA